MNESRQPCEVRLEDISLLSAGCLTMQEESDLREHLAGCSACRQRFEEISLVCSNLRMAKPAVSTDEIRRVEQYLQHPASPMKELMPKSPSAQRRAPMLAVVILAMFAVLSLFVFRPTGQTIPRPIDVVEGPPAVVPKGSNDMPLPTLLALNEAAAESDESFNRLLSRYSDPSLFEPLNNQPSRQESLQ